MSMIIVRDGHDTSIARYYAQGMVRDGHGTQEYVEINRSTLACS